MIVHDLYLFMMDCVDCDLSMSGNFMYSAWYIHAYMHTCMYIHTYVGTCTYTYVCMYVRVYTK